MTDLQRSLSLRSATLLIVGNVVGAGIFTTAGFLAEDVSHPWVFVGIWIVGGGITLCGALTYAELGAMYPRAGGDYQYLKEAYGPWAGFLVGWLSFWIITPGSVAALSLAFVDYLPAVVSEGEIIGKKELAIFLALIIVVINYRSTRLASSTQDVVTTASIVLLVGLVIGGGLWGDGDWGHFTANAEATASPLALPGSAMIAVVFTYSGWFAAAYVGSEIKRPGRNVPLSLLLGTVIVTVVYTAVNGIYLFAVGIDEMPGIVNIAQVAAQRLFSGPVSIAINAAILLAIASCINASVMTGSRVCYAMARDELFPAALGRIHPRLLTPHWAVLTQGALAVVLILVSSFGDLLTYVVFAMVLCSIATAAAMIVLRFRAPELSRPYRTFGYPLVPILFIATYGWIGASIVVHQFTSSMIGLILVASAVPFYFVWIRLRRRGASN